MRYDCGMTNHYSESQGDRSLGSVLVNTEPRVNVTVRLTPTELESIDVIARREERSRSQVIRRLLQAGLQAKWEQ